MPLAALTPLLLETRLPVPLLKRGKVRDVYELPEGLLMVATDRISAFDVVLPNGIPDKGLCLTQISNFWFQRLEPVCSNHLLAADAAQFPRALREHEAQLRGRSVLVRKVKPLPVECIARGYLAGSGWREYKQRGAVCGIKLPRGLREAAELPEPLFTPSTKAERGHDVNISFEEAARVLGKQMATEVKHLTLALYAAARDYARQRGILIADTKFEFGTTSHGELLLIDECLTPDSSRFWPREKWRPGSSPPSYDKQYVRDYLETLKWDKRPPAPSLPEKVVEETSRKYKEAYRALTGQELALG